MEIFTSGRAMFYAHFLYTAPEMRGMEDDFGILPFPKKDEKQENYITGLCDTFVGFCVPADNKDPEFVGTIMEALCVSGSKNVIPAYYRHHRRRFHRIDKTYFPIQFF